MPTLAQSQSFSRTGNTILIGNTRLEFCTPEMFRVSKGKEGIFPENEPWMVTRYTWEPVTLTIKEEKDHIQVSTSNIKLIIHTSPLRIDVYTADGRLLSAAADNQSDSTGQRRQLQADEHFFGFGERMDFLDQRGKKIQLNVGRGTGTPHAVGAYNVLAANYSPVPFFMSTKGYGVFLHTAAASTWDMGEQDPNSYSFQAADGALDYYFIYGPRFTGILEQYTALTGRSPLLPLSAMGLHVGTYSGGTWGHEQLTSAAYVVELARRFREMGIPVDILFLDSTWRLFGKNGGKGATSYEWRETFHHPKEMFDSLYALHYSMVGVHMRSRLDNGTRLRLLDTANQLGYTYPEGNRPGEFINFFDTTAVNWWWEHAAMRVAGIGARFFKTDEGSAFGALANESNKTGPSGPEIQRLHNLFPIAYAKAAYEKYASFNKMRGMNHTREGYAGIQRYPFIFAGDWPSEWQYFEPVIKAGLNIGLSGVGYWAHCMGGFEHPADPELYIRWCQFGMLSPVALLFGMDHPGYKEPWNYGKEAETIFKQYDELRYSLLPYLYSTAREQYENGTPIMRALVLEYQDDERVYNITDQYLLGNSIMVCPVTQKGAATRVVYLPKGKWTDYWTGKVYEGRKYLNVVTPLDKMPIFIKEGSIIPFQPVIQYTEQRQPENITLAVYPTANATFTLYADDGKSMQYQQGRYAVTHIRSEVNQQHIKIQIAAPVGNYQPGWKTFTLKVYTGEKPATVKAGQLKWYYNEAEKCVYIDKLPAAKTSTVEIN
jgi:alpha-glucosidase (family GH31 glycosyl hydrolase)